LLIDKPKSPQLKDGDDDRFHLFTEQTEHRQGESAIVLKMQKEINRAQMQVLVDGICGHQKSVPVSPYTRYDLEDDCCFEPGVERGRSLQTFLSLLRRTANR
jgi:hypothetical protein